MAIPVRADFLVFPEWVQKPIPTSFLYYVRDVGAGFKPAPTNKTVFDLILFFGFRFWISNLF